MKLKFSIASLFVIFSASLYAQHPDTLRLQESKLPDFKTDSLIGKARQFSLNLDTLNPHRKLDAVSSKIENAVDSLNPNRVVESKISGLQAKADSLSPTVRLEKYKGKLDGMNNRVTSLIDSLKKLTTPDLEVMNSLGKLMERLDSMKAGVTVATLDRAEQKLSTLEKSVSARTAGITSTVNSKLDLFNQNGGKLGNVTLPNVNSSVPGIGVLQGATPNLGLPSQSLPSLPRADLPSLSGTVGPGSQSLPGTNGLQIPNANLLRLPKAEIGELKNVQKEVGSITGGLEEAGKYKKDLKTITSGEIGDTDQLSEDLEKKAGELGGVKDIQKDVLIADQYHVKVEKWNSDPEYRKELAVNQAKELAVNHFMGHEKELMAAMDKLSNAKSKLKDAEEVADIFGKRTNPMKGKPFIERLRPGLNLQVQWKQIVFVDINPCVGYRISGRWTAGIGWNERIGFSSGTYSFSERDRVYGVRSYAQFKIKESNYLMLAPECMNTYVLTYTVPVGESGKKWVPGLMAGYKREFRYSSKVLGTVQIMYNLVAPAGQSPYADRFNLLVGFEFPQNKKLVPQ